MKRALLAALAAISFVTSAWAAPADYVQQSRLPYARRVAVVYPSRWDALNQTNVKSTRRNIERGMGNAIEMLKEQGAEVHYYNTNYFRRTTGGQVATDCRNLWYTFGTYYPLTIVLGEGVDQSLDRIFFCPDSTTTQLVHFGGAEAIGWADSTFTGIRALDNGAGTDLTQSSYSSYIKGCVRPYGTTDTLFFSKIPVAQRAITLPVPYTGDTITSVVRLFEPLKHVSGSFIASADSDTAKVRFPDAGDSVAIARDIMPLAWRVYWNYVVGGAATHRYVDFVKSVPSPLYSDNIGHVLYALCSRYVQLDPIRMAVDFDDVFDMDTNGSTDARPTNAAWDSTFTALAAWGVKPGIAVNPGHAASYIQGQDPTYEKSWSGPAWSWPNNRAISWVHHAHDSTRAGALGNIVGRFGGYQPNNGSNVSGIIASFGTSYAYSTRQANISPSAAGVNYGIVQRLYYSDSLRKAYCPNCIEPPYLNFPNNEVVPINWRARTGVTNTAWGTTASLGSTTSLVGTANSATGSLDSLYYAFATGLRIQDRGTLYLRTPFVQNVGPSVNFLTRPWGDNSVKNYHISGDRDSSIASTPFVYPGERSVAHLDGGGLVDVRALGTIAYDGGGAGAYRPASNNALATLYGTRNAIQTPGSPAYIAGESFDKDVAGLYTASPSNQPRNFTSHQRARIIYCHPLSPTSQFVNATGPNDSYAIDVLVSGVLQGKKALDDIAGHTTGIWVMPWEVLAK